jgi:hypothetical protein
VNDLFCILRRNDAAFGQHVGVGFARGDILAIELAIDIDRHVDISHDGVLACAEASAPHLVGHDRPKRL